jgi:hypothetical protein
MLLCAVEFRFAAPRNPTKSADEARTVQLAWRFSGLAGRKSRALPSEYE